MFIQANIVVSFLRICRHKVSTTLKMGLHSAISIK